MKLESNLLEELLSMNEDLEDPVIAPEVGEKYHYHNLLGISIDFEIVEKYKEYYDILLENGQKDILPIDYDLVSMLNDGTIIRIYEEEL
jgi:hypothetical protein